MEGKKANESRVVMAQLMNPLDANLAGNVHGGVIMRLIDTAGGVAAFRHARTNVVTASVDRLDFIKPAYIGNLITVKAIINFVGRTSMEAGVRVDAEDLITGEVRRTASAYITYVALDKKGKPTEIPPLILETEDEIRRNCEAKLRREMRLRERTREGSKC